MKKMGWKKGQGLGSKNQGIPQPIKTKIREFRTGLGYDKIEESKKKRKNSEPSYRRNLKSSKIVERWTSRSKTKDEDDFDSDVEDDFEKETKIPNTRETRRQRQLEKANFSISHFTLTSRADIPKPKAENVLASFKID